MIKWHYAPLAKNPRPYPRRCLVAYMFNNEQPRIHDGWVDENIISHSGYAWSYYPNDFAKDTTGWKSTYLGDEEPSKGRYLLCLYKNQRFYECRCSWYDPKKSVFPPGTEVMAWRKIIPPKPRDGDNVM